MKCVGIGWCKGMKIMSKNDLIKAIATLIIAVIIIYLFRERFVNPDITSMRFFLQYWQLFIVQVVAGMVVLLLDKGNKL